LIWYPLTWDLGSPLNSMRYLYVLLVLSLAALLWVVWSIAKHVRKHGRDERRIPDPEDMESVSQDLQSPSVPAGSDDASKNEP
jgi:hypothetical protein